MAKINTHRANEFDRITKEFVELLKEYNDNKITADEFNRNAAILEKELNEVKNLPFLID